MVEYGKLKNDFSSGKLSISDVKSFLDNLILKTSFEDSDLGYSCKILSYMKKVVTGDVDTMAVHKDARSGDIVLEISPKFCFTDCRNEKEILAVLHHEVLHILYSHVALFGQYGGNQVSRVLVNLACDVHVNLGISNLPKGAFDFNAFRGMCDVSTVSNFSVEERLKLGRVELNRESSETTAEFYLRVYDYKCKELFGRSITDLVAKVKYSGGKVSFEKELLSLSLNGESRLFNVPKGRLEEARRFARELLKYIAIPIPMLVSSLGGGIEEVGGILKDLEDFIAEVKDIIDNSGKGKGYSKIGSGNSTDKEFELEKSTIRWDSIVKLVCRSKIRKETYRSRRKLNRRQPNRLELSGVSKKELFNIVVACDESGSITDKEYIKFISEVKGILKDIKCEFTLLRFTSKIKEASSCNSTNSREVNSLLDGCLSKRYSGGTSFQEIFNYLDENRYPRDSMVIVFTDGYAESSIDFRGYCTRKWVLASEDYRLSVRNEVVRNVLHLLP